MAQVSIDQRDEFENFDLAETFEHIREDRVLFCLHCNRLENHTVPNRFKWYYSLLVGFTFGAILLVGPFHCRCCGHRRFFVSEEYHPRVLKQKAIVLKQKVVDQAARLKQWIFNKESFR
jgi:hypothetical protein